MKKLNFIDRHVGSRVRQLRLSRGVDRQDLARMLAVSVSRLEAFEEGRERISAETMRQLSRILQAPPTEFFAGLARQVHAVAKPLTAEQSAQQEKRLIADFARIRDARSREVVLDLVAAYAEFGEFEKE